MAANSSYNISILLRMLNSLGIMETRGEMTLSGYVPCIRVPVFGSLLGLGFSLEQ